MDSFTDYYTVLGVDPDASPNIIKAAFKKLALQYHPDIYKGEDAHERMRILLAAYQTLNDPAARKQYDARRSEHLQAGYVHHTTSKQHTFTSAKRNHSEVSPSARRDRQRHYDFPDFRHGQAMHIDLIENAYTLPPNEARALVEQGMLRGMEIEGPSYFCHRCHHRWNPGTSRGRVEVPSFCPKCQTTSWNEYLLLRCRHCCAVFESEQIRYEIGTFTYGKRNSNDLPTLCPPYELFPLCPYCGTAQWCPAEEIRLAELRQQAERRAAMIRLIWLSIVIVMIVLVGFLALGLLK